MKVLFVDDEEEIREQAKIFLEKENEDIDLDITSSFEKAARKLKENNYDTIVSDYHMPKADGIHLLKHTKKEGIDIPFILFTGKGKEKVAMQALNHGADRYITKEDPISEKYKLLARAIRKEVERKNLKKDLETSNKLIQKTIDSLPTAIVVLDGHGNVIRKNDAWDKFSRMNELINDFEIGDRYFDLIEETWDNGSKETKKAKEGLKDLRDDERDVFSMEYSISGNGGKRTFLMRGTKFFLESEEYIVLSHLDISK